MPNHILRWCISFRCSKIRSRSTSASWTSTRSTGGQHRRHPAGGQGPISKEIMRVLLDKPGLNISEVTRSSRRGGQLVAAYRARAPRGAAGGQAGGGESREDGEDYHISEDVVKRWSQVLGLSSSVTDR